MMHYKTAGNPENPAIMFLHGFMGAVDEWDYVVQRLQDTYYVILVDLPGHGQSTHLKDDKYSIPGVAEALVDLLKELKVDSCTLVGYSMGGRLALYTVLHYPEYFQGLVVVSASPGVSNPEEGFIRRMVDEARAVELETLSFEDFLKKWYRQGIFAPLVGKEKVMQAVLERRRHNDPTELARVLRGMGAGSQPSVWERLTTLTVPTVLLAGAQDKKYAEITHRMADHNALFQAKIVPKAGHVLHLEMPDEFISLLEGFMNSR